MKLHYKAIALMYIMPKNFIEVIVKNRQTNHILKEKSGKIRFQYLEGNV